MKGIVLDPADQLADKPIPCSRVLIWVNFKFQLRREEPLVVVHKKHKLQRRDANFEMLSMWLRDEKFPPGCQAIEGLADHLKQGRVRVNDVFVVIPTSSFAVTRLNIENPIIVVDRPRVFFVPCNMDLSRGQIATGLSAVTTTWNVV